jgi:glucose-1-phosphate adenylyltransferase
VAGRRIIFEDTLAMVLAGGQGERLYPLTRDRSKPAVPFGGLYRIIDFTLSNCLNSGLRRIYVLTQYKSGSLERHIQLGWDSLFSVELGEWIYTVPPQLRIGQRWYEGTADAVFHNVYLLERERPARVMVLSGDHVYKMDYRRLIEYHLERGAVATVGAVEVPLADAHAFGVMQVDDAWRITSFTEKPTEPEPVPERANRALVNMGVYCFETEALIEAVTADGADPTSLHDFAHDVLPRLVGGGRVFGYPFVDENRGEQLYWRDIGTIDAYYAASMDLVAVDPVFNLYDREWPLRTMPRQLPPAKTVFAEDWPGGRAGVVLNSLLGGGVVVSGGHVERSILAPEVRVNSFAQVSDSVLLDGVQVGRYARIRRAIVDKRTVIPAGFTIGEDPAADRARFTVSEGGVVVIPQGALLG